MRRLVKPLLLVALVLAVPIVPFVLWGERLEPEMERWVRETVVESPLSVAALVVALLAVDIVLPVPSSVVSTAAGSALGFWAGTAASWTGMTIGSVAAFMLARAFGRPLALRFSSSEDMDRIDVLADRYGPLVLVLARPIPVLAEASVLLFGTTRLAWRWFLIPVALSNLGIAAAYALLGERVALPVALVAAILLPLLAAALARRFWPKATRTHHAPP